MKILTLNEWVLIKEAEGEEGNKEAPKTLDLIMYDSPRTVIMNNLNKLRSLFNVWSNENGYEIEDNEVSSGRGIRDPYLKFTIRLDSLLFDFVFFCPVVQARKGKELNTVGGYYCTIVMNDTSGFSDEGRHEKGEENPMLCKKVIDLVKPEEMSSKWLKKQIENMMKETDGGTTRNPTKDGDEKPETEEDTF